MQFLEDQPTAYLDEMQQYIFDSFDIDIATQSIGRYLRLARWSRKVVKARAKEQSLPLRIAWQGRQHEWDEDQLVFIDKSAANERTGDRRYGWSPQGIACRVDRPLKHSERWSILPALTCDGYIDWVIHHGAINAELFIQFLEERVLPNCSPYPGKMSVLVMDNASIHKNPRLREICDNAGVLLVFLPPYSPDFNPIESTFKDLKAWIKRHYQQ
jgi:transposase